MHFFEKKLPLYGKKFVLLQRKSIANMVSVVDITSNISERYLSVGGGYKSLIINNLAIICAGFTRSAACFGLPLFER